MKTPRWESNEDVARETYKWIEAQRPAYSEAQFEFLGAIDAAIAKRDHDALARLTDDQRLRRYAFQRILKKPGPRTTGGRKLILEMAAELVDQIHGFWKIRFGKWKWRRQRGPSLAITIAADHFTKNGLVVDEDELATYIDKERHR